MNTTMNQQHVLVLGASSGIGLATAEALLNAGAVVTLAGRDSDRLQAAHDALLQRTGVDSGRLRQQPGDAAEREQVVAMVASACDDGSQLDAAIFVPGGGQFRPVLLHDEHSLAEELASNVVPFLTLLKAAVPHMQQRGGSLVALSSTAAVMSSRYLSAYCAGKAALEGFIRTAADELGEQNIRINAVRPGLTHTGATDAMFAHPELLGKFREQVPLPRLGEPMDIAGALLFLASRASSWMTGQCITVDGGHTLRAFPDLKATVEQMYGPPEDWIKD